MTTLIEAPAQTPVPSEPSRGRRRHWPVVATVAALALAGAGWAVAGARGSAGNAPSGTSLPPETAQVTKETLVDTETADGTLGYGSQTDVNGRLAGTVTGLPDVGATVKRGQALYRLDDDPVALFYGSVPAYRTLAPGVEGRDVRQLEQNLEALGYAGFTVDDEYTWATADAVEQWQDDRGLPETGRVELGRVVFTPGQVRIAAHHVAAGDSTGPGQKVLSYTGTSRMVTLHLDVADQRLATEDATVQITLPDGRDAEGRITDVTTVVDTSQEASETKVEVQVALAGKTDIKGYDSASVEVQLTADTRPDVLTVPVTALLALAEGGYGVQVVEGTTTRIVAVQTGLFAKGRVEISGAGLAEGMTVGVAA